jgi:hypothetical protein
MIGTKSKGNIFVKHIMAHLKQMPEVERKVVICKICGKSVDEIYREAKHEEMSK